MVNYWIPELGGTATSQLGDETTKEILEVMEQVT